MVLIDPVYKSFGGVGNVGEGRDSVRAGLVWVAEGFSSVRVMAL